jgi:FtsP/CotA-like multicopper oxidase with cupredoxin domain
LAAGGVAYAVPVPVRRASAAKVPDVEIRLTAAPARTQIREGAPTNVLRFTGEVVRGRSGAVQSSASYLGPTLVLVRGERVRIRFRNRTGEPSVVHWHGMLVPEEADGHPRHAIESGREYVHDFVVRNPAGTYLYHPHPHGQTGPQVYRGLAGLLIVREPTEHKRGLPIAEQELALVIQDRRIGTDNELTFSRRMMAQMTGVLGDTVLVNGQADAAFAVTPAPWRVRVANVSNARIYKLAWSDGRPMRIVATDNGLVSSEEGPIERPYVVLAPFERVELLEDFGSRRRGAEIALESQAFSSLSMHGMMGGMMDRGGMMQRMRERGMGGMMDGILDPVREMLQRILPQHMAVADGVQAQGMGSMMEHMMGGGMGGMMDGMMGPEQGEPMHIARFRVAPGPRHTARELVLPEPPPPPQKAARELYSQLAFRHMRGFFNGRDFDMSAVADDERLPLGRPTVWTFANDGAGMAMAHPVHIHGVRFRILERSGSAAPGDLREGVVDSGFKDTFLIFPGERVRVHVVPTQPGLFMYHCHNLEHEDSGMMRNCSFDK